MDAALAPGYPDDPLVEGFRVTLKRSDIATLGNLNWLNDEVCFEIKRIIVFNFFYVWKASELRYYPVFIQVHDNYCTLKVLFPEIIFFLFL